MVGDDRWHERYSRQLVLDPIGEEGQRRLGETTVAVVGAGALGSNSAEMLVRMGFGHVRLIDRDVLELSNLHRARVLGDAHVGQPKAHALAKELLALFPEASIEAVDEDLTAGNALALLEGADLVLDGLDNMTTRYIVNDACMELGIPWVYGGIVVTGGLVAPLLPGGPCLRCLFPEPPEAGSLPTCESAGIHPSAAGVVASIQVAHATRLALGQMDRPRLIALDIWTDDWRVMDIEARTDCPSCSGSNREFLEEGPGETVTSLCGQDAVQINPARRASIDLDARAREWEKVGQVSRRGPMLVLDLGDVSIHLFTTGRALVKGTAEVAVAKSLYTRYVGN